MEPQLQAQITFYLTGRRAGDELDAVDGLELRPALLAGYRDLTPLRYDFPLVLARGAAEGAFTQSLSGIVDGILGEIAPRGIEGERLRSHLLQLEREIRVLVAEGAKGPLSVLWDSAAQRLASRGDEALADSLNRARAARGLDGEVVDCDEAMPARLLTHAWKTVEEKKAYRFRANVTRLIVKLSDILRAEFVRSEAGQTAKNLKATVGAVHGEAFDFEVMSRLLTRVSAKGAMAESRRRRIDRALSVLRSQRFFPLSNGPAKRRDAAKPYSFVFESCGGALEAFRERLPGMIEVAKAMAIAGLDIEGCYNESKHDPFFEAFGENAFGPKDVAPFPAYLIRVRAGGARAVEHAQLLELLAAGLPMKILVQFDDILEPSSVSDGHLALALQGARLASMAIGLNEVYVLQSSGSNLFQLRERMLRGLACPGPAVFSVFSGAGGKAGALPPYLVAAAAMQSRAFPAFTYDPSAGPDWASRFSLDDNPQAELDWPVQSFGYEDEAHQRIAEELAFTFIDFVACDRRYAGHFAKVPRSRWNGGMVHAAERLASEPSGLPEKVPYVLMVDRDDKLHRVIVDDKLVTEARRCRELWRSLQELGGIHNSHAERLLARERAAWEERRQREIAVEVRGPEPAAGQRPAAAAVTAPAAPAPAEAEPERPSDEPSIETPRCTTCDECTQINNKMFAYDANKQAYIANLDAGTYAQLVEAAESCQVSIIHPGKPRNANEPGLDELIKRAEAFP